MSSSLCYLATLVVSVALAVWGFYDVLKEKQKGESDSAMLQRQLRGFGFLVLAQVVAVIGISFCVGVTGVASGVFDKYF